MSLSIGGAVHDPSDPVGRLLFNVLAMVAEFEADLIRMQDRQGEAARLAHVAAIDVDVDGALVGGASLDAEAFATIVAAA